MEDLKDHYRLKYKETDEVPSLVAQAAPEILFCSKRKKSKKQNKYREDQKLFWSYGYEEILSHLYLNEFPYLFKENQRLWFQSQ